MVNRFCMSLARKDTISRQEYTVDIIIAEILFEFCLTCDLNKYITMPVVQGAFAACKVREREMKVAKMHQMLDQEQDKMFYHGKYLELSPLKYNSKLMNSIWGLYNRYSVHNFKKITDGANFAAVGNPQGFPETNQKNFLVSEWGNVWSAHKH